MRLVVRRESGGRPLVEIVSFVAYVYFLKTYYTSLLRFSHGWWAKRCRRDHMKEGEFDEVPRQDFTRPFGDAPSLPIYALSSSTCLPPPVFALSRLSLHSIPYNRNQNM